MFRGFVRVVDLEGFIVGLGGLEVFRGGFSGV